MTNNKLTDNQLTKIIESAEAVISALAGTNEDVHPDNSTEMCRLYDWLNDNDAPPEVVLAMAHELQERRKADCAEPVAWLHTDNGIGIPAITRSRNVANSWLSKGWKIQPLYTVATQSTPLVKGGDDAL